MEAGSGSTYGKDILPLIKANGKADRFSENLMKWVRKNREREVNVVFLHWSNLDGSHVEYTPGTTQPNHILLGHGDADGYFFGAKLTSILNSGAKAETFAFPPKFLATPLPEWWGQYIAGGKCFIDPGHHYYCDRERWAVSEDGKTRRCVWCGEHHQYKHVEMVPRESWRNMAP